MNIPIALGRSRSQVANLFGRIQLPSFQEFQNDHALIREYLARKAKLDREGNARSKLVNNVKTCRILLDDSLPVSAMEVWRNNGSKE